MKVEDYIVYKAHINKIKKIDNLLLLIGFNRKEDGYRRIYSISINGYDCTFYFRFYEDAINIEYMDSEIPYQNNFAPIKNYFEYTHRTMDSLINLIKTKFNKNLRKHKIENIIK